MSIFNICCVWDAPISMLLTYICNKVHFRCGYMCRPLRGSCYCEVCQLRHADACHFHRLTDFLDYKYLVRLDLQSSRRVTCGFVIRQPVRATGVPCRHGDCKSPVKPWRITNPPELGRQPLVACSQTGVSQLVYSFTCLLVY